MLVAGVVSSTVRGLVFVQKRVKGSGFVIDGRRILTNFHVVQDAIDVRLRKHGVARRWRGKVIVSAHDCDLVRTRLAVGFTQKTKLKPCPPSGDHLPFWGAPREHSGAARLEGYPASLGLPCRPS